eukprot:9855441-Karenia_brevis.AAC.1
MGHRDFIILTETHGIDGKALVVEERLRQAGYMAYWSHGTTRRAGVAIIIKQSFIEKFRRLPPQWVEISTGEIACLHLYGPEGDLDT